MYATHSGRCGRVRASAAAAILSLALGIGATTAIFTVMDALVFRPLPVKDPQQLALVYRGAGGVPLSYNMWNELREQQDVFSGMFAYMPVDFDVATASEEKRSIPGLLRQRRLFQALWESAAIAGRTLQRSDDARGAPLVCVISYGFWQAAVRRITWSDWQNALSEWTAVSKWPASRPPVSSAFDVGETFDVIVPLEKRKGN